MTPDPLRHSARWRARLLTCQWRTLPDFVILGVPRGGTTSLFNLLSIHSQVHPAFRQETHFFNRSERYNKGVCFYRAFFPLQFEMRDDQLTGEGTSVYLFRPSVRERMVKVVPEVKLIVLLRDPTERAIASWRHFTDRGEERRTLLRAITEEIAELGGEGRLQPQDPPEIVPGLAHYAHVQKGRYADQLQRWFEVFPRNQFLILRSEDLFADPDVALSQVLGFLGLRNEEGLEAGLGQLIHKSVGSISRGLLEDRPDADEARDILRAYFDEPNRELQRILGALFEWM